MNTSSAEYKGLYGPDDRLIPAAGKETRVKRAHVVRYFGYGEEKKLVGFVSKLKGKQAARDRMILDVGFGLGLRVAEIAGLTVGHVRLREKLIVIGKGRKERIVPISRGLQRAIKDFIRQKLVWKESIHDDAPLFVSKKGTRLVKRAIQQMFEAWCLRSGLLASNGKAAYTCHCMRHTFAMRLRERGYTIESVAELLGHSSLNSTRVYFRPSMEELIEAVESL